MLPQRAGSVPARRVRAAGMSPGCGLAAAGWCCRSFYRREGPNAGVCRAEAALFAVPSAEEIITEAALPRCSRPALRAVMDERGAGPAVGCEGRRPRLPRHTGAALRVSPVSPARRVRVAEPQEHISLLTFPCQGRGQRRRGRGRSRGRCAEASPSLPLSVPQLTSPAPPSS